MDKVRIVIVEDEFAIAEDISVNLGDQGYDVIGKYDKGESALTGILNNPPDVLLADIRLFGAMTGIELVSRLNREIRLPVIYITANSDDATYQKAKSTHPHAFLIKPFSHPNLLAAIDLALFNFSTQQTPPMIQRSLPTSEQIADPLLVNQNLFIKSNGKYKKIKAEDLLFVEADGSYVHLQTLQERFTLSQNLTTFSARTPLQNLVRVHRSYMINIGKVESFEDSHIYLHHHKIPMGDHYKAEFLSRIKCL